MPSLPITTPKSLRRYAIAKADTGEFLSLPVQNSPLANAEFSSSGTVLMFKDLQWTYTMWLRWLTLREYITRGVTVPREPIRFNVHQEPPSACIVAVDINPTEMHHLPADPNDYSHRTGA